MDVILDLKKTASENARSYYDKAKKSAEKLVGAKKALEETSRRIEKLAEEGMADGGEKIRKKAMKERRWYDKFRWFESSDNFLVIGGRDAVTNEILIKKHAEKNDLVFHADVHGAPFFVVKNLGNKEIPENTKKEAAEAAASYSSSWKRGLGSCDVYQVSPEQVSKKAESGEYLPKGGFMIRGHKNWFRNTGLRISVGFIVGDEVGVVGGPVGAVSKKTKHYAVIGVGDLKSKELAMEIKKNVLRKTNREQGLRIKDVKIDEIQKFIPNGEGRVLS